MLFTAIRGLSFLSFCYCLGFMQAKKCFIFNPGLSVPTQEVNGSWTKQMSVRNYFNETRDVN